MRRIFLIAPIVLAACGTERESPVRTCGGEAELAGDECASLGDCGAGAQNFVKVQFCEHCFARADTHFCEAGVCRAAPREPSNVNFVFAIPSSASGAKSFTVATVNPVTAGGSKLSCAALMAPACSIDSNGTINARNSRFTAVPAGDVLMGQISIDPGQDRMLVVQLTSGMQGTGEVLARGCTELDVPPGGVQERVEVVLEPVSG